MKKCVINDEKSAIEYIHYVLNEWGEWKTHHTTLVQALELLLNANESRRKALVLKSEYIARLHQHIDSMEGSKQ